METSPTTNTSEIVYRGETVRRSLWVSSLLDILAVGWGQVYLGRLGVAIMAWAALWVVTAGLIIATEEQSWFALRPVAAVVLAWIYLQVGLVWSSRRWLRRCGSEVPYHPAQQMLVLLLVGGVLAGLPWWIATEWVESQYGLVTVEDSANGPVLLAGEWIYYQRLDPPAQPGSGEAVVFRVDDVDRIARIIGAPGESIEIEGDGGVRKGGERLVIEDLGVAESDAVESASWSGIREQNGGRAYTVIRGTGPYPQQPTGAELGDDEYFLLTDNRWSEPVQDSRALGPQTSLQLVGRPAYILFSRDPESGAIRWSRIGLAVR